jgi:hypothetical protein
MCAGRLWGAYAQGDWVAEDLLVGVHVLAQEQARLMEEELARNRRGRNPGKVSRPT